jgi:hypothetical protein
MLPSVVASDPAHHANALSVSIQKQPRHPQPYAVIVENPRTCQWLNIPGPGRLETKAKAPSSANTPAESRFRVEVTSPVS